MNLKLDLKPETLVPLLKRLRPLLIGGGLVAAFGYTAFVVNAAVNVQPVAVKDTTKTITFDKATIKLLQGLEDVSGSVPQTATGSANPFAR